MAIRNISSSVSILSPSPLALVRSITSSAAGAAGAAGAEGPPSNLHNISEFKTHNSNSEIYCSGRSTVACKIFSIF